MIRKNQPQDTEAVLNIWLAASIKAHDFISSEFWLSQLENMRRLYLPASEVYVYEQDGDVVGFYALKGSVLAAIFVDPAHQGRGIGKALLQHARAQRKALSLTVYKANQASCAFYLKHGFSIEGEQQDPHTGHPELLMTTSD
ncbi:GCN5 family acetyltransferase [Zobellella denitrificans]|uniref:GCN5 family acetyltransferase n=1 Tax=Zobellella denitrificans TaxID=347534 RepID=A0A291HPJ9_9GAMM|nr:N-acetyltransferase [Zobellella denitrificans]ATG74087.1 GCN5 family acetyltransferase [Zobellella denitrificans]